MGILEKIHRVIAGPHCKVRNIDITYIFYFLTYYIPPNYNRQHCVAFYSTGFPRPNKIPHARNIFGQLKTELCSNVVYLAKRTKFHNLLIFVIFFKITSSFSLNTTVWAYCGSERSSTLFRCGWYIVRYRSERTNPHITNLLGITDPRTPLEHALFNAYNTIYIYIYIYTLYNMITVMSQRDGYWWFDAC